MTNPKLMGRRLLLARLLGRGEPETTCEDCFDQLDRYVDLQLSGNDADRAVPSLRPHLDSCPACREDYESLRTFVAALPQ